ncbi:unnamed protein product [Microthlaspi erraticum]|uniref:F-box associated beta-propeller type 1 domain-containing protein n=1 Tax=Microthlaspi erraticum TaxID=1685480 RepID=A0A6D2K880_9BRAS|nr:unnamed protein product [Microthlaspi erraticum]
MQTLSSVREEKISVMLMRKDTNVMEVWITDKIEPDAASWKKFMVVKDQPILSRVKNVSVQSGSFFIDEDKKVVVVCVRNGNIAYLIKENGYYKEMVLGESNHLPIMCSYVPSSMQIQKGPVVRACGKEKEREYI